MTGDVISDIRNELTQQADEKTKSGYQRFFKEAVTYYGVGNPLVNKIAARYYPQVKSMGKKEIFRLCEELLKSNYSEEALIACEWSYRLRKAYEPGTISSFSRTG